jgi:hypothetical protein
MQISLSSYHVKDLAAAKIFYGETLAGIIESVQVICRLYNVPNRFLSGERYSLAA